MLKATRSYIDAIATAISDKDNIKFKESQTWQTDIKSKTIEYNPTDLVQLPALASKGLILHETAHVKYTDDIEQSQLAKDNKSLHDVYNVLEDIRIEENLQRDYGEWADEAIEANSTIASEEHREAIKNGSFDKLGKLNKFLYNILSEHYYNRYSNQQLSRVHSEMRQNTYSKDREVFDRLEQLKYNIMSTARSARSTQEITNYVDNTLYPQIKDFIEEANKQPDMQSVHGQKTKPPEVGSKIGNGRNIARIPNDNELEMLLSPYINTLARRLQDVLKERASTRYTGSYKHGKLLSKNAYKVLTDDNRIFSKKINPTIPHYTISFLLDESGSMQGERHANTYIGSYLLDRACQKLKFNIKYCMFESNAKMVDSLSKYRTDFRGGGNDEERALDMIRKNTDPKDDNLILMLTDGGAGVNPRPIIEKMKSEGYEIVAVAVGLGRNSGETSELQRNYPYTVVAEEVEKLPSIMIELLRKMIHR